MTCVCLCVSSRHYISIFLTCQLYDKLEWMKSYCCVACNNGHKIVFILFLMLRDCRLRGMHEDENYNWGFANSKGKLAKSHILRRSLWMFVKL